LPSKWLAKPVRPPDENNTAACTGFIGACSRRQESSIKEFLLTGARGEECNEHLL
jgi:hypothetical protein